MAGAELRFVFWPEAVEQAGEEIEAAGVPVADPQLPGRMVTWEPPRLLELTWDTERLRFELEPVGAGTVLRVTVRASEPGPRGYESTAAGYHTCLDALVAHLDGGRPRSSTGADRHPRAGVRRRSPPDVTASDADGRKRSRCPSPSLVA